MYHREVTRKNPPPRAEKQQDIGVFGFGGEKLPHQGRVGGEVGGHLQMRLRN